MVSGLAARLTRTPARGSPQAIACTWPRRATYAGKGESSLKIESPGSSYLHSSIETVLP